MQPVGPPTEPPYGPRYGSAAGIPAPPDAMSASMTPGPTRPAQAGRARRRRLRLVFVVPVVVVVAVIAYLVGSKESSNGLGSLRAGDCIAGQDTTYTHIDTVDCDQPHTQEVYATGSTTKTIATGTDALTDPEIIRICRLDVDPRIIRVLGHTSGVEAGFLVDSDKTGTVVCTAISTTPRTGSLVAEADS
ncbi:MAG: hypothetical protein JWL72_920 [Ilumatobacteraceae bacterium]|nr:hypothetical protein [Ilumatobacteraceae bacterium]MCU1387582.1 hypothetical protein [Ilumatobacteraceae bacterium]